MSWRIFRWTWRLDAPLCVGTSPAGALNRCRLYVPARALWGAMTAELSRAEADSEFPQYDQVGKALREQCRFTYLYPSERHRDGWMVWLPEHRPALGLCWVPETGGDPVDDRAFRRSLLWTRAGTAIDPKQDAALDGSLRETECVQSRRMSQGGGHDGELAMAGYVFVRDAERLLERLRKIDAVQIGGDARYGLGLLSRVGMEPAERVFGSAADTGGATPRVFTRRTLAHSEHGNGCGGMQGGREVLGGWNRKQDCWEPHRVGGALWTPGSALGDGERWWEIRDDGVWSLAAEDGNGREPAPAEHKRGG